MRAEVVLHGDRVITDNIKWIKQEPKWILVTEKLPEKQGLYLVTIKSGCKNYIDTDIYSTLYKNGFRNKDVIAWMDRDILGPYEEEN